jgi:hypothetical protein
LSEHRRRKPGRKRTSHRSRLLLPVTATAVTAITGIVLAGALVLRANQPGAGAVIATVLPGSHAMTVLEHQRQQMIVMDAAAHTMHLVSAPEVAAVPVVGSAAVGGTGGTAAAPAAPTSGVLTPAQVGALWLEAGGPAWAEAASESVAMCESSDNTAAMNPDGASGLWQILGQVVPGNLFDGLVNARNAVAKFTASGDTWAQWTCQP